MWVDEFYDKAYDLIPENDRIPVIIPSCNNLNSSTMRLLKVTELQWPITMIVRKSQYEDYRNTYDVDIRAVDDELIDDVGKVRKWIVENYSGNIFMFDDDLTDLFHAVPTTTKKGEYKAGRAKVTDDISKVLAMWQLAHEYACKCSSNIWTTWPDNAWFYGNDIRTPDKSCAFFGTCPNQCFCINLDVIKAHGLNFVSNREFGAEDVILFCQAYEKGLLPVILKFLTYSCKPMKVDNFMYLECTDIKDRLNKEVCKTTDYLLYLPFVLEPKIAKSTKLWKDCYKYNIDKKELFAYMRDLNSMPTELYFDVWHDGDVLNREFKPPSIEFYKESLF